MVVSQKLSAVWDSCWFWIVENVRGLEVTDWLKIFVSVTCAGLFMWTMVQAHELRLNNLEKSLEKHVEYNEKQVSEINSKLTEIQVNVSRVAGAMSHRYKDDEP